MLVLFTPIVHSIMSSFFEKLEDRVSKVNSLLCVGLDPHLSELFPSAPPSSEEERCDAAFTFCKTLIDVTGTLCVSNSEYLLNI